MNLNVKESEKAEVEARSGSLTHVITSVPNVTRLTNSLHRESYNNQNKSDLKRAKGRGIIQVVSKNDTARKVVETTDVSVCILLTG